MSKQEQAEQEHAVPLLHNSRFAEIVESSHKTINVGMSIYGEVYQVVEIVDLYHDKMYALTHKRRVVVLSTDKRYIDLLFVDLTGMSTE